MRQRINKYVSGTGICSRREADALVEAGRVTVNGRRAQLGTQVGPGDTVCVDGEPVGTRPQARVYIALNKPVGITCTTETHVEGNIVDFVGHRERIFPIGRLDKDSEGLILLTNDGDIVNEILRSENNHEKEYIVTVDRPLTDDFLRGMAGGVAILGTMTKPCTTRQVGRNTFRIVLTQGLNRQIRRMCEVFGYNVRRLQRVRIVNIQLGNLPVGRWRDLTADELGGLLPRRFGDGRPRKPKPAAVATATQPQPQPQPQPRRILSLKRASPGAGPRPPRDRGGGKAGRPRD